MKFFSKLAENITPYTAGEQPQDKKYIKLNTNENPYPPSLECSKILKEFDSAILTKYPDPDCTQLRELICKDLGIKKDNIFIGNGSDEILAFAFGAFFDKDDKIAINDITYSFYPVYAEFYGIKTEIIPLKEFRIDIEKYKNLNCKGIIIANPNAPTSLALSKEEVEKIISWNKDKVVIIDEAYVDFCKETVQDLVKIYDNLLVTKTFSKSYGLAGARCGYCIGNENLIDAINRIKNSFNSYTVNSVTQSLALASYKDKKYFQETVNKVIKTREKTIKKLLDNGYNVLPSDSNFLFLEHQNAEECYLKLKDNGILVRYFSKHKDRLRITIGTDLEMEIFLETLFRIDKKC